MKNFYIRDLIKERHYASECLVINDERLTYISNRLKRKKVSFKLKIWNNITSRDEKCKIVRVDEKLNFKKLIESIASNYNEELKNGGCIEIVTTDREWCLYHKELAGAFLCSRILEKLNIKIQEAEEDAKLSDEVPGWIENFLLNQSA